MFTTTGKIVEYIFKNYNSKKYDQVKCKGSDKYLFAEGKIVPWIRTNFPGWKPPSMMPT
jgi:hypothetical protein